MCERAIILYITCLDFRYCHHQKGGDCRQRIKLHVFLLSLLGLEASEEEGGGLLWCFLPPKSRRRKPMRGNSIQGIGGEREEEKDKRSEEEYEGKGTLKWTKFGGLHIWKY